jgi:DtxR family Mn-dependent transcriptional regulator
MSESEEMYLLTVAKLVEAGAQAPIPVSRLAQELSIQPISANQMIRKLEEAGWVRYTPYKGVTLTAEGEGLARRTLRRRRLWEVFLVDKLKMTPDEADELACRLEHVLPAEVAERLAGFLDHPATSPRGEPIPDPGTAISLPEDTALSQMEVGQGGQITRVEAEGSVQAFLAGEGVRAGARVTMLGRGKEGTALAEVEGRPVYLARGVAEKIWVRKRTGWAG